VELEALLHYAAQELERWPSSLRVMPKRWLTRLMAGRRAEFAALARVVSLRNWRVEDAQLKALVASEALAGVEELDLNNAIRDATLEALMTSPKLGRLKTLRLQNNALSMRDAGDPARWLRQSACAPVLERLMLGFNHLNDQDLEALASVELGRLRALELHSNQITQIAPLFRSQQLAELEVLSLKWNKLADLPEALASSMLRGLTTLDLTATGLDARAARGFAESQAMPRLATLKLGENPGLGDAGLQALAGARWMEGLRSLSLAATGVHAAGLAMLAERGLLAGVTHLNLMASPGVNDAALEVLSRPGAMPALRSLNLSTTQVSARGLHALVNAEWAGQLEVLQLERCALGDEGARVLAEASGLRGLRTLLLGWCEIGDEGAIALSQTSWLETIGEGLVLEGRGVSPETWLVMSMSSRAAEGLARRWRQRAAQSLT
jgi:hypothetical protein